MAIGSPSPPKTISQPVRISGDLTVTAGGGLGSGHIRTRPTGVNTGGGDVVARHVYTGGSAGGLHILNTTAGNDFSMQPDGSPATNIVLNTSLDSVVVGLINIATGAFTINNLVAAIDGAQTFSDGRANSGLVLPVNAEARSICNEDFTPVGWRIVSDTGAINVQLWRQAFGSYDDSTWIDVSGTATGTTGMPHVSLGLRGSSTGLGAWASTADWTRGDVIRSVVTANAGSNGWYAVQVYGYRNVKKT